MPVKFESGTLIVGRSFILVLLAVIVQAFIAIAWLFSIPLPKPEAWQAFAFLFFMAAFLL